jgi:hypothetical protein
MRAGAGSFSFASIGTEYVAAGLDHVNEHAVGAHGHSQDGWPRKGKVGRLTNNRSEKVR